MSNMKDREKAFENKYARDEEFKFKVTARRNKLAGLWVAEKLGKSGEEAEAYAKEVVMADFEVPGDDDVVQKIKTDLHNANFDISEKEIRQKLLECFEVARAQYMEQQ